MNNKMMTRKSVLKSKQSEDSRRVSKRGMKSTQSSKKPKELRKLRAKTKKAVVKNHTELSEYESSKQELPPKPVSESRSNSSVIYIQTLPNDENVPVIDLTRSNSSITLKGPKSCILKRSSLQTLYKNKTINIVSPKNLAAKSLIAIPVNEASAFRIRKVLSTPQLLPPVTLKEKIAALEIPPDLIDESDYSEYNFMELDNTNLDENDMRIINNVMDIEADDYQSLLSISSSDLLRLNENKSVEDMVVAYGVNQNENLPDFPKMS